MFLVGLVLLLASGCTHTVVDRGSRGYVLAAVPFRPGDRATMTFYENEYALGQVRKKPGAVTEIRLALAFSASVVVDAVSTNGEPEVMTCDILRFDVERNKTTHKLLPAGTRVVQKRTKEGFVFEKVGAPLTATQTQYLTRVLQNLIPASPSFADAWHLRTPRRVRERWHVDPAVLSRVLRHDGMTVDERNISGAASLGVVRMKDGDYLSLQTETEVHGQGDDKQDRTTTILWSLKRPLDAPARKKVVNYSYLVVGKAKGAVQQASPEDLVFLRYTKGVCSVTR